MNTIDDLRKVVRAGLPPKFDQKPGPKTSVATSTKRSSSSKKTPKRYRSYSPVVNRSVLKRKAFANACSGIKNVLVGEEKVDDPFDSDEDREELEEVNEEEELEAQDVEENEGNEDESEGFDAEQSLLHFAKEATQIPRAGHGKVLIQSNSFHGTYSASATAESTHPIETALPLVESKRHVGFDPLSVKPKDLAESIALSTEPMHHTELECSQIEPRKLTDTSAYGIAHPESPNAQSATVYGGNTMTSVEYERACMQISDSGMWASPFFARSPLPNLKSAKKETPNQNLAHSQGRSLDALAKMAELISSGGAMPNFNHSTASPFVRRESVRDWTKILPIGDIAQFGGHAPRLKKLPIRPPDVFEMNSKFSPIASKEIHRNFPKTFFPAPQASDSTKFETDETELCTPATARAPFDDPLIEFSWKSTASFALGPIACLPCVGADTFLGTEFTLPGDVPYCHAMDKKDENHTINEVHQMHSTTSKNNSKCHTPSLANSPSSSELLCHEELHSESDRSSS